MEIWINRFMTTKRIPAILLRRLILVGIALICCALNMSGILVRTNKQSYAHEESIPSAALRLSKTPNSVSSASEKMTTIAENTNSSSSLWTIDIISIGSKTRPHYQHTQLETFGSHPAVRHFWNINEVSDTETACHTHLTLEQVHQIRYYCGKQRRKPDYPLLNYFARLYASPQYLAQKSNPAGWMCAQKRPIDAFVSILQQYDDSLKNHHSASKKITLPDYLFIIDDDTYVNVPLVLDELLSSPSSSTSRQEAKMVAGCMLRPRFMNFSFPFGGFGYFISKASLERWMWPLYCTDSNTRSSDTMNATVMTVNAPVMTVNTPTSKQLQSPNNSNEDDFESHACRRIVQDQIGEGGLFRPGMSIAELMHAYTTAYAYLDIDQWTGPGFCFHSDTALAYFSNYYRLSEHASTSNQQHFPWSFEEDRLIGYKGSVKFLGRQLKGSRKQKGECNHRNDTLCTAESELCHYITPGRLVALHNSKEGTGAV